MVDPIEIIKRDHRRIEKLFKEYEDTDESAHETRSDIVERIIRELKLHMEMEESILYPRAEESFDNEEDKMIEEARAEHDIAKSILEELSVTHPEDARFDAKVKVLNETITHHVMEEEEELLPRISEHVPENELNGMGEDMKAFKLENEWEETEV